MATPPQEDTSNHGASSSPPPASPSSSSPQQSNLCQLLHVLPVDIDVQSEKVEAVRQSAVLSLVILQEEDTVNSMNNNQSDDLEKGVLVKDHHKEHAAQTHKADTCNDGEATTPQPAKQVPASSPSAAATTSTCKKGAMPDSDNKSGHCKDKPEKKSHDNDMPSAVPVRSATTSELQLPVLLEAPPTRLLRHAPGGAARCISSPGAFAVAPTSSSFSLSAASSSLSLLEREQEREQEQQHEEGLIVANPVTQADLDLPRAEPFDATTTGTTSTTSHQQTSAFKTGLFRRSKAIWILLGGILVIVVVIVLTAALLLRSSRYQDVATSTGSNTTSTSTTTEAEANIPSVGVTENTYDEDDALLQKLNLPSYTLAELQEHPGSPQSKALEWVRGDPHWQNYSDYRLLQRYVLANFYMSTNGDHWQNNTNWMNQNQHHHYSIHECDYHYTLVDELHPENKDYYDHGLKPGERPCQVDDDGEMRLQHLWLFWNNLRGVLPLELFLLTSLRSISFYGNHLHGNIPSQIGQLQDLDGFSFVQNDLSGMLPTEVGSLTKLLFLGTFSNPRLGGSLPTELGNLRNLQWLMMHYNSLTGSIPSELGLIGSSLEGLYLAANKLTGTIPTELMQLQKLQYIAIFDNLDMNGPVPSEIGMLTSLQMLYLQSNKLSGQLPSEVGLLSDLRTMWISENQLSGQIPSELGLLTQMARLYLEGNTNLSGTIPSELGLLGTTTSSTSNSSSLTWISANKTALSGTIPEGLCSVDEISFDCSRALCGCDCPCHDV